MAAASKGTASRRPKAPESPDLLRFTVDGRLHELTVGEAPAEVEPTHTLAHTLRETLGLTGTKVSCDRGACGCC